MSYLTSRYYQNIIFISLLVLLFILILGVYYSDKIKDIAIFILESIKYFFVFLFVVFIVIINNTARFFYISDELIPTGVFTNIYFQKIYSVVGGGGGDSNRQPENFVSVPESGVETSVKIQKFLHKNLRPLP